MMANESDPASERGPLVKNAETAILKLPSELISRIFGLLQCDVDFFNARRASRGLESASLAYFGHRFFRKKGFMITTSSLHVLKQIAAHNVLGNYVRHVWFNPDCFTFAGPSTWPYL